jgi:hypothetical protein
LLLGRSLEALPGKRSTTKVHEDVAQALEVVATGLFDAEVGVDGGVAGGAGEILVFAVGDVEVGFGVAVFFGETKVDDVDLVAAFADAHEEVVGFDVSVDEGFGMDVFDSGDLITGLVSRKGGGFWERYELVCEEEDCFEGEFAVAKVEEVFERGTKEIENHGILRISTLKGITEDT